MSANFHRARFCKVEREPPTLDEIVFIVLKSQKKPVRVHAAVNLEGLKTHRFGGHNRASAVLRC